MVTISMEQRETWRQLLEYLLNIPRSFYDPIQRSTIVTPLKKQKQQKVISVLKENRQALELFFERNPEKHEAFKYPFATFPLVISTFEGKLYQSKTKYHYKNYFIALWNPKVNEIICT